MKDLDAGVDEGRHLLRLAESDPAELIHGEIAQPFIDALATDGEPEIFVDAIVHMGHTLNLEVVAEGVETPEQLAALRRMGCNMGSCHGSFQGKGGFRLSLFGFDPEKDYPSVTREGLARRPRKGRCARVRARARARARARRAGRGSRGKRPTGANGEQRRAS